MKQTVTKLVTAVLFLTGNELALAAAFHDAPLDSQDDSDPIWVKTSKTNANTDLYNLTNEPFVVDGCFYQVLSEDEMTVRLTGYDHDYIYDYHAETFEIPSQISLGNNKYTVISIGENALGYVNFQSIVVPQTVTELLQFAFQNSAIESITLPDGLKAIPNGAFYGCRNMKDITIPESVTEIDNGAFSNCVSLLSLNFPKGLKIIGDGAFSACSLSSVLLPESVEKLGAESFLNCNNLETIEIKAPLIEIEPHLFEWCSSLKNVVLPETVRIIGECAFSNCQSLSALNIPASVGFIGNYSFLGCSNLSYVEFPSNLVNLGAGAFEGCQALTSIALPDNITVIRDNTFRECFNLTYIDLPPNLSAIEAHAFEQCHSMTSIDLPENITVIGDYSFGGCFSLTTIALPQNLRAIGAAAFANCNELQSIEIPTTVEQIGEGAFSCCQSLTYAVIPYNVSNLGQSIFEHCENLLEVRIESPILRIPDRMFTGCINLVKVEVPSRFELIGTYAFANCRSLELFDIPETVIELGEGAFAECVSLKDIRLPVSLRHIGPECFTYCLALESIRIPENVEFLGGSAFNFCENLAKIIIDAKLHTIEWGTFRNCTKLTEIDIPSSVSLIGNEAFSSCIGLKYVLLPESLTDLGAYAFNGCNHLRLVLIPENLKSVGQEAFNECNNLEKLYVKATTPPDGADNVFSCPTEIPVYVPTSTKTSFEAAIAWHRFTNFIETDNFDVQIPSGEGQLDESEWELVKTFVSAMMERGWWNPWNISAGIENAADFKGLSIRDGKVVGIYLENEYLQGSFPTEIFSFPYIETINLAGNSLEGSLEKIVTPGEMPACASLKTINISGNRLEGNIGAFALAFPNLVVLDASYNRISNVIPMISPTVRNLKLTGQSIPAIPTFDIAVMSIKEILSQMPDIIFYDHESQSYNIASPSFYCSSEDGWSVTLTYENNEMAFSPNNGWYRGSNGGMINVMSNMENSHGSNFNAVFSFEPGDVNFSGVTDISDLQAVILNIFDEYSLNLFNYTAANFHQDETINVQDVVLLVNHLLAKDYPTAPVPPMSRARATETYNTVWIEDGKIMLDTDSDIAALSIDIDSGGTLDLTRFGMIADGADNRKIAYSLTGGHITPGIHEIGTCPDGSRLTRIEVTSPMAQPVKIRIDNKSSVDDINVIDYPDIEIYNMEGMKLQHLQPGVNIIRHNGNTQKIIIH